MGGGEEGYRMERLAGCLVVRTECGGFKGLEGVERLAIGDGLIGGCRMELLR